MGYTAYLVGGIVRDLALGRENVDLDIAVEGDAWRLAAVFARKTGAAAKGFTRFGTCKVESKAFGTLDIAAARAELYRSPGALPDVRASHMGDDLARRDFTINAMALCLAPGTYGRLLDPFGGLDDLAGRKLRVLHPRSFEDDPTRVLRGIRFAARYGFAFETGTLRLLKSCIIEGCLGRVSGTRVFADLKLISSETRAGRAIGLMKRYGVTASLGAAVHCGPRCDKRYMTKVERALAAVQAAASEAAATTASGRGGRLTREGFRPLVWLCRFATLFAGLGESEADRLASRLSLPKRVREVCAWVASDLDRTHRRLKGMKRASPYRVVKVLRSVPPEGIVHIFAVSGRRERNLIEVYLKEWRHICPGLTGHQVVALGIAQGPLVGKILDGILRLKLQGGLATPTEEIAYVRRRAKRLGLPVVDL
jgi:tRNA nucleotidyltransferase (CCA-adding enzyme)